MNVYLGIAFAAAAPLLWAAMGGLLSERSGVVNIGLEGMVLLGAFFAVVCTAWTGNPIVGVLCAAVAGALLGGLHAWLCLGCRIDHIVSGVAINLLAAGVTGCGVELIFGMPGTTPAVEKLPVWRPLGVDGPIILPLHLFLCFVWILLTAIVLYTPWGIRLHAAGEAPAALRAAGVRVTGLRFVAVIVGGALAGLGGAELAIAQVDHFSIGMSGGRGFLALAALICGRWHPIGVLAACFAFGLLDTLGHYLQNVQILESGLQIPSQLILTFPFVAALLALALSGWGSRPPSALGKTSVNY